MEYHFLILFEAGLLAYGHDATDLSDTCGHWIDVRLTWAGHDFLDSARSSHVWGTAKRQIGKLVESVSFDVLK